MQTSFDYSFSARYFPTVTLIPGTWGWTMHVQGERETATVEQAITVIRTCINGDFEGWEGDTIVVLCNGQVWQQSDYNYHFAYGFTPDVLIYRTPYGGYRMVVDRDYENSVAVMRLR